MDEPERGAESAELGRPLRTNLLLSASIEGDGISGPVRIRNLSENGAMLEGSALPPVGARLVLRRLKLEIGATVIWLDRTRCGVRFDGIIAVAAWREGNWIAPADRSKRLQKQAEQERNSAASATYASGVVETDALIGEELVVLRHLIDDLGAQLVDQSNDPHKMVALQQFDLVSQTLGYLADVLKAEDRKKAIEGIGLERLRLRLEAPKTNGNI